MNTRKKKGNELHDYLDTSGFWQRARALRAPVFLGLKPPSRALRAPSHPQQLRCFLIDPQKYILPRPSLLR
jgi:hypothetical protein